jgi:hypothetical protein
LREGDETNEGLTDLTNLMVGLAAILFVVGVDKRRDLSSVFGRRSGCEIQLDFASAGLALVDVAIFLSRLKYTTKTSLNSRGTCREEIEVSESRDYR